MSLAGLLVANRGEIAIRIMRTAFEMGIRTVAVYSEDDANSLHTRKADEARPLRGVGASAYLDFEQIVATAKAAGCDAIHPGYGFLSENAEFAARCRDAGIIFVGPDPQVLGLFGDKVRARELARKCGVPVLRGIDNAVTLGEARDFFEKLGPGGAMMIKAVAGGGGRGMRPVWKAEDIAEAYARCESEARTAFGIGDVYVEEMMPRARHIEVQALGDGSGSVSHLWERECTIQRRNQKFIETAPSPNLAAHVRDEVIASTLKMAEAVRLNNLATFEFLVAARDRDNDARYAFIEANPRLQVEHTVTEEVTGTDLVRLQIELAEGKRIADLGMRLAEVAKPRGSAIQLRINLETLAEDGTARPSGGTIAAFEPPSGPGLRVDTYGYQGYTTNPRFDSTVAKLIAHSPAHQFADVVKKAYRALCEFRIDGVRTNIGLLQAILRHPDFVANNIDTRFVEEHAAELIAAAANAERRFFFENGLDAATGPRLAGAKIDTSDPLAVLAHGKTASAAALVANGAPPQMAQHVDIATPEGTTAVSAPMQGTIVSIDVREGDQVRRGQQLLIMEAMKMEHVVAAPCGGTIRQITVARGDAVFEGHPLVFIEEGEVALADDAAGGEIDLDRIRPDLAQVIERHDLGMDAARQDMVERRRKTGQLTARENIDNICDPGSFVEYGALTIAAQRRRRAVEDLIKRTPADGMVVGVGHVNGDLFDDEKARCIVMAYDYTVLAGTQGQQNHRKKDRMFELAEKMRLPVILFAEGGGGRPGDTDGLSAVGLDCMAFNFFGRLSGLVPLVGITSGRCFAGNAALLGCSDVVIATAGSNIGMGGPAMIEGGGLGIFRPEEVGPMDVQVPNGVVDIPVADEAEAARTAKKYLSYFQGPIAEWTCADQRLLRNAIPENRLRIYDIRAVIETLADTGSVLELRRDFGRGMVTALIRIEGRPLGLVANNPAYLAGAIDSNGADKAARFIQLCDAFDIPIVFLCDTPGIMVGPEIEKTGLVRHAARMFVVGASVTVPFFTVVLRKGYGLGAQAMAGGSFKAPIFTVSWPTGEFGGMGLEGAVKLGYRKELEALEDPAERKELFDKMVARMYEVGKAVNVATHFEFDDVIDPMDTRKLIVAGLRAAPPPAPRDGKKRSCIDTW